MTAATMTTTGVARLRQASPFSHVWAYLMLTAAGLFVALPMLVVVMQSLSTQREIARFPPTIIPMNPTLQSYSTILTTNSRLLLWLGNSLFTAGTYVLVVLIICTPAAYAFARLRFPGSSLLFGLLLLTLMIPSQVTLIPNYLLLHDLKMLNTFNALIFPGAANVFAVFLLRQFFIQIPHELEEAALLDGAGYWGRFRHVILPLSTNVLVALSIFTFLAHYNDVFWPFIVLNDSAKYTLPVGLSLLNSAYPGADQPVRLSASVLASIPTLIVYVVLQRHIIKGVNVVSGMSGH
jgi:multiple sugar transport system permease protein